MVSKSDDAYSFSPFLFLLFFPFFFYLSSKLTWKTGIYRPSVENREETAFPMDDFREGHKDYLGI